MCVYIYIYIYIALLVREEVVVADLDAVVLAEDLVEGEAWARQQHVAPLACEVLVYIAQYIISYHIILYYSIIAQYSMRLRGPRCSATGPRSTPGS